MCSDSFDAMPVINWRRMRFTRSCLPDSRGDADVMLESCRKRLVGLVPKKIDPYRDSPTAEVCGCVDYVVGAVFMGPLEGSR
jgi:hypothetical protein